MKLRIAHTDLAAAVAFAGRALSARPSLPVLAGILLEAADDQLRVRAFDYETGAETATAAQIAEPGQALVSGRLLADIMRHVRGDIDLVLDGPRLVLTAQAARFTLHTLPLAEYPALPHTPQATGVLTGKTFADAVAQVATAVGRDDTLPVLTGIQLTAAPTTETLTLAATDRYRFAARTLPWDALTEPSTTATLLPGKKLHDIAKAASTSPTVTLALPDDRGLVGLSSEHTRTTIRTLEGQLPSHQALFPTTFTHTATVDTRPLSDAVKRVSLVAERSTPIELHFSGHTLTLQAGGSDDAQATEQLDTDTSANPDSFIIRFNPAFLMDGLAALGTERTQLNVTDPVKPALLHGADAGEHELRYLLMPVRTSG